MSSRIVTVEKRLLSDVQRQLWDYSQMLMQAAEAVDNLDKDAAFTAAADKADQLAQEIDHLLRNPAEGDPLGLGTAPHPQIGKYRDDFPDSF